MPNIVTVLKDEITRHRKEQTVTLAALRGMGKQEAHARMRQLAKQKPGAGKKA